MSERLTPEELDAIERTWRGVGDFDVVHDEDGALALSVEGYGIVARMDCDDEGFVKTAEAWAHGGSTVLALVAALRERDAENERLTREIDAAQWSVAAYQQDASQFSRVFGRTTFEMVFENASGARQTPTVYVFRDGSAYAPIFGSAARLFKSVEALAHWMEPQIGNGFKFVGTQKRAAVTP